jgi:hypothetical protein
MTRQKSARELEQEIASVTAGSHAPLHVNSAELIARYNPHLLRAGDMIHVREDGILSTVTNHHKGRAGTEVIQFSDHPEITVAGEAEIAVFRPRSAPVTRPRRRY